MPSTTERHEWAIAKLREIHAVEMFGDCVEDGQKFPCRTIQILTVAMAEACHCGRIVAALAEPGLFANTNMVDRFCGRCITVRCDAYPGACDAVHD